MARFPRRHRRRRDLPFAVDPRQVDAMVGAVAIFMPISLFALAQLSQTTCFMTSISHFYYTRLGGDILVGSLSVVGAVMIFFYVWKGDSGDENVAHDRLNAWLARFAGLFALGVAFFPTGGIGCRYGASGESEVSRFLITGTGLDATNPDLVTGQTAYDFWFSLGYWPSPADVPWLFANAHYLSATGMFAILAWFALGVFTRVQTPQATTTRALDGRMTRVKKARNGAYFLFGGLIVLAMLAIAVKSALVAWLFAPDRAAEFLAEWDRQHATFWFESLGLVSFGATWVIKGRLFGLFDDPA